MATFLVTGAAGFIGSNVTHALVEQGESVRALDNLSTGHLWNIKSVLDRIEFTEGDITNSQTLMDLMEGVDVCLHFAAINSVPRSIDNPIAVNKANVEGSIKLFIAARDSGVKRVISASSSSVCGTREGGVSDEEFPYAPISPYSVSKTAVENYARVFTDIYGMDITIFRYFNVFGPRQDPNSPYSAVVPKFIKALLAGEMPTIHGDGTQSRDFTFVQNVVHANLLGARAENRLAGIYNIACGDNTTVLDMTKMLMEVVGVDGAPQFDSPRQGDIRFSQANIEKARRVFGYTPQVSFREGLERTVEWYREQGLQ